MAQLSIEDLSFRYPHHPHLSLSHITLSVEPGEFIVICGPSGSGKSTLLRQLKRELRPAGDRTGQIRYNGMLLEHYPLSELVQDIGMVMQDPEQQTVVDDCMHELVFGLENLGYRPDEMHRRAAEVISLFGMETWIHKKVHELSGGELQTLNLASVIMTEPRILLLDEPTAQLDPVATKEFIQHLRRLNEEFGMTIIMVEHRLDEIIAISDRIFFMDAGELRWGGETKQALEKLWRQQDVMEGIREFVPTVPSLFFSYADQYKAINESCLHHKSTSPAERWSKLPLTVREGKQWISGIPCALQPTKLPTPPPSPQDDDGPLLELKELYYQYGPEEPFVLHHCSLTLYRHDFLALLGSNGSGKTTLLKVIMGIIQQQRGSVRYKGQRMRSKKKDEELAIGYVAQNPMLYFSYETVEEELMYAAAGIPNRDLRVQSLIQQFDLKSILQQHPYDLSGGEKQKVMLACVLLTEPELILLDEPTKGIDPMAKAQLGEYLLQLSQAGKTLLLVTHDVEFAARYASRCALMFNGRVMAEGPPRNFLSDSLFYTTMVNRVLRDRLPKAIVLEDVAFE